MKKLGRLVIEVASSKVSVYEGPERLSRLSRKIVFATASALLLCATFALPQTAKAEDPVAALTSFAQQIDTPAPQAERKADQQAFAALKDFAQRLGTAPAQSTATLPKLTDAGSLIEFLQQKGSSSTAPDKAKAPAAAKPKYKAAPEATFVDSKVCSTCHAPLVAEFQKTLMGRIGMTQKGKFDCQNCHGPGSAHVKAGGGRGVGGMLSFGETDPRTAEEKNAICIGCHQKGDRINWRGSTHETRGLACTNCHTVMKQVSHKFNLKTSFEADTCFQCHKDRRAQMFRSSHMPLREGKVTCSDCHNPHGSFTESLLREDSINDTCYKCHAEKRGPFLFEHAPVRENCDACHDPHGTLNEYSLKLQRPALCFECHNLMTVNQYGLHHYEGGAGQSCQNCHTQVHGSNSPGGSIFGR